MFRIYPGADAEFILYEDDGTSLDYQNNEGEWIKITWKEKERKLTIDPDPRSTVKPAVRTFKVSLAGEKDARTVKFSGEIITVRFE